MRQVNLLPDELQKGEKARPVRNSLAASLGLAFLLVLSIHLLLAGRVARLEKTAEQPSVAKETPELQSLRQEIARLKVDTQRFADKNRALLDILSQYFPSPYILKTIGDVASGRVWLKELSLDSQKEACQLDGNSFDTQLVSEFMLELKKLPYFRSVDLISMEKADKPGEKEVDFVIICNFK